MTSFNRQLKNSHARQLARQVPRLERKLETARVMGALPVTLFFLCLAVAYVAGYLTAVYR